MIGPVNFNHVSINEPGRQERGRSGAWIWDIAPEISSVHLFLTSHVDRRGGKSGEQVNSFGGRARAWYRCVGDRQTAGRLHRNGQAVAEIASSVRGICPDRPGGWRRPTNCLPRMRFDRTSPIQLAEMNVGGGLGTALVHEWGIGYTLVFDGAFYVGLAGQRTDFGRAHSSMRLRTVRAMAASVC